MTTPKPNGNPSDNGRNIVATHDYCDECGELLLQIVRFDPKGFSQRRPKDGGAWDWSVKGVRVVPYRVPELLAALKDDPARIVFVVEGEKDVDNLARIGIVATCNAGGAGKWKAEHAEYLQGGNVAVIPDNDKPGRKHAEQVARSLIGIAASVRVVELLGLDPKGDVSDWIEAHGPAADPAEVRAELERLADAAQEWTPAAGLSQPAARVDRFQPFPTDALPEPIRGLVGDAAEAMGCDPSYIALPMLSAVAAAIGNTRRLELKRGWTEPAIIWTAIVGDSGAMKSPALELALQPTRDRQSKAMDEHAKRMSQYQNDLLRYDRDLAGWKKSKAGGDPPMKPDEPIADRCWCDDLTPEALAVLLKNQPRGLLVIRDELAGWLMGFDRYAQRQGADVARWLEMFGGRSMVVDRKSGNPRTLFVPRAAVSVTGGIQPDVLRRCLGQEYRDNGLAARLLLAYPPRRPKRWTEATVDASTEAAIVNLVDRLYAMELMNGEDGDARPIVIGLTPGAKQSWVAFYNKHAVEQAELTGDLSATWSKLEGYAARFALIIHCVRSAAGDPTLEPPDAVDQASIKAGIRLSQWFGNEARRILAILDETDEGSERRRLVELIERKDGSVTSRDLMRSCRRWKTAAEAEAALDDLAKAGDGRWVNRPATPEGGRPTRVFVLADAADDDITPTRLGENGSSVNVDGDNLSGDETELASPDNHNEADVDRTPTAAGNGASCVNVNGADPADDEWEDV